MGEAGVGAGADTDEINRGSRAQGHGSCVEELQAGLCRGIGVVTLGAVDLTSGGFDGDWSGGESGKSLHTEATTG